MLIRQKLARANPVLKKTRSIKDCSTGNWSDEFQIVQIHGGRTHALVTADDASDATLLVKRLREKGAQLPLDKAARARLIESVIRAKPEKVIYRLASPGWQFRGSNPSFFSCGRHVVGAPTGAIEYSPPLFIEQSRVKRFAVRGTLEAWKARVAKKALLSTSLTAIMAAAFAAPLARPSGLQNFSLHLFGPSRVLKGTTVYNSGWHAGFNIPAFLVVMLLTVVLVRGIQESAETNNIMVLLKIAAILAFVVVGIQFIHPSNYHPFVPQGWSGVLTGGSIIFFTYIGFDSVSTAAEEARNPQRDLPIGIIATLVVCTVLYIAVAVVLTGMTPWQGLIDDPAPVVNTMKKLTSATHSTLLHWTRLAVLFGAMMGMISSLLVFQLGQARVWFAMSRDGLLPRFFGKVHPRYRTPAVATWIAGVVVGVPAGILDIGTLADLSNIGTLFAFVLVSAGVIILRRREPNRRRGFRAPLGITAPVLSLLFCMLLMAGLPILTWLRFFAWLVIGLVIYMLWSRRHSTLATGGK